MKQGLSYLLNNPKGARSGLALSLFSRYPIGTNIFDLDWDIAIILDTCRVDVLREVEPEYPFIDNIGSMVSVGGATPEWVCATFDHMYEEEINKIAYIAGNGFAEAILTRKVTPEGHEGAAFAKTKWNTVFPEDFGLVDFVWRADDGSADDWVNYYSLADTVTDHAIAQWRNGDFNQMIVHYVEPHHPYIHTAKSGGKSEMGEIERQPFGYLNNGGDRGKVWEMYKTELRAGLDAIQTLINNVDAERVLITADHGEAFGEWGGYHHRSGSLHPHVRRVPVVWTTASDSKTRKADFEPTYDMDRSLEEHLSALGYK